MTSSFLSSSEPSSVALPKNTLAKMRVSGEGPAFHKLGKRVRYSMSDLEDWLKAAATPTRLYRRAANSGA